MYRVGLVVGKFAPLHKGHEFVINTAFDQCDRVVILSYTSLPNAPKAAHRRLWLTSLFPDAIVIVLEDDFPDDGADELIHRTFCRDLLKRLNLSPDAVFGSEKYIDGFASVLGAEPVVVDLDRRAYDISGTMLRNGGADMSLWCNNIVTSPIAKTILLIGGESSGKSTLAEALHKALPNSDIVKEYGRTFGEKTGNVYHYEDMLHIAQTQVKGEEDAMVHCNDYVICDTSPLVTEFYSRKWHGKVDPMLSILALRKYDYVFFCRLDFPYVNDGTRSGIDFSDEQASYYHTNILQPFVNLFGTVEQRINIILESLK